MPSVSGPNAFGAVADPSAGWLDAWAGRLRRCGASHVRAPHTAVPLPSPLAVKSFAERTRRAAELAASSPRFVAIPTLALYADACADALGRMPAARTRVLRAQVTRLVRRAAVPSLQSTLRALRSRPRRRA